MQIKDLDLTCQHQFDISTYLEWSETTVQEWLSALGFQQAADRFRGTL
jgi:hypothetical protein